MYKIDQDCTSISIMITVNDRGCVQVCCGDHVPHHTTSVLLIPLFFPDRLPKKHKSISHCFLSCVMPSRKGVGKADMQIEASHALSLTLLPLL